MPHLSIIIPHRHQDQRFETTILSVLENRPADCEIIAVHDGSYRDPYQLTDELLFVEVDPGSHPAQLLNAGVMASCSPVICNLLDGMQVDGDWAELPLSLFENADVHAVAVGTQQHARSSSIRYGIDANSLADGSRLQRGQLDQRRSGQPVAGPSLACGFLRKRSLLALGGWDELLDTQVADVELAWMMHNLQLTCLAVEDVVLPGESIEGRNWSNRAAKQLAELSVAFGVTHAGAASAMSDLLRGCLTGSVSAAVSWATGVMGARSVHRTTERLEAARSRLEPHANSLPVRAFPDLQGGSSARKAA